AACHHRVLCHPPAAIAAVKTTSPTHRENDGGKCQRNSPARRSATWAAAVTAAAAPASSSIRLGHPSLRPASEPSSVTAATTPTTQGTAPDTSENPTWLVCPVSPSRYAHPGRRCGSMPDDRTPRTADREQIGRAHV